MTAVLSLFTKSDKDLHLLVSKFFERSALHLHSSKFFVVVFTSHTFDSFFFSGFGVFIRPHHKKQYKQMLDSIINQSVSATDVPAVSEDRQRHGKRQSLLFCIWKHAFLCLILIMSHSEISNPLANLLHVASRCQWLMVEGSCTSSHYYNITQGKCAKCTTEKKSNTARIWKVEWRCADLQQTCTTDVQMHNGNVQKLCKYTTGMCKCPTKVQLIQLKYAK